MLSYYRDMTYTNIKLIMDRITRHPLMQDIPFETVVDCAVDFIRIVGTPPSFVNKVEVLKVERYRAELPCDFYEMIQVRDAKSGWAFRYTSDSFHLSGQKPQLSDLTYKIQNNVIFTSIERGDIEISYMALPVDDEGYPLIPDNSSYTRALEAYIKRYWFTIQFDLGKINAQVMNKADQDYAWAVGQAQTDLIRPTIDQMEMISNMWNKFLPDTTRDHRTGFLHEGTQEHIRIH